MAVTTSFRRVDASLTKLPHLDTNANVRGMLGLNAWEKQSNAPIHMVMDARVAVTKNAVWATVMATINKGVEFDTYILIKFSVMCNL